VLIALFADIHANRQAFEACLADARRNNADSFVFLGDYVGYGADPEWVLEQVMALTARGAPAVLGNHDHAVGAPGERMNTAAGIAIEWTRGVLGEAQRQFLATLPLTINSRDRLFVHASAAHPESWPYIVDVESAADSFAVSRAAITFCGHVHCPGLYSRSPTAKMTRFVPTADAPIPLLTGRRWIAVIGSVGQPRDGNPAASYATFDTDKNEIVYRRVPYDIETAAARILEKGLPPRLAERLFEGQ
jgi:diadenosine tetraphosphatase ApaH/serine/threonine PP2A family protein phosphatase